MELQTQQEFLGEMEKSHSALIADKKALEIKAYQLEIENVALREEISHSNSIAEVCISFKLVPLTTMAVVIKGDST